MTPPLESLRQRGWRWGRKRHRNWKRKGTIYDFSRPSEAGSPCNSKSMHTCKVNNSFTVWSCHLWAEKPFWKQKFKYVIWSRSNRNMTQVARCHSNCWLNLFFLIRRLTCEIRMVPTTFRFPGHHNKQHCFSGMLYEASSIRKIELNAMHQQNHICAVAGNHPCIFGSQWSCLSGSDGQRICLVSRGHWLSPDSTDWPLETEK